MHDGREVGPKLNLFEFRTDPRQGINWRVSVHRCNNNPHVGATAPRFFHETCAAIYSTNSRRLHPRSTRRLDSSRARHPSHDAPHASKRHMVLRGVYYSWLLRPKGGKTKTRPRAAPTCPNLPQIQL